MKTIMLSHRCRNRQMFRGGKDSLPEFPQTCPKNLRAANVSPTKFL